MGVGENPLSAEVLEADQFARTDAAEMEVLVRLREVVCRAVSFLVVLRLPRRFGEAPFETKKLIS
jgi:hypothetical protein